MKIGVRKPSLKKSISAKTKGKVTRAVRKSINPIYGKKGMGYINNPEKAVYNSVYNKTTVGLNNFSKTTNRTKSNTTNENFGQVVNTGISDNDKIIKEINQLKASRKFFNIIGYFFVVPGALGLISSRNYIFHEPIILFTMLLAQSPFIFLLYKAKKYGERTKMLETNLKESNTFNNIPIDDINNKLDFEVASEETDSSYDKEELIESIQLSNTEFIANLQGVLKSIRHNDFGSIINLKDKLVINLGELIKSCSLLEQLEDNIENITCIESILSEADGLKFHVKILVNEINIIKLDYEYEQNICYDSVISTVKSITNACEEINDNVIELSKLIK